MTHVDMRFSFGRFLFLMLFAALLPFQAQARHIIGGELTYECLGDGDYEFTMRIYRDRNCSNCADFDEFAFFAIYRCNGRDCSGFSQNDYLYRINVPLQQVVSVEEPDYPCLIPPDVDVEEGNYRFRLSDYGIRLPPGDVSYHVSYQRCCRNETIDNIVAPDDSGATYSVEITPDSQRRCNSSPTFRNFPPTIICLNAPLEFDHSAIDPEGDSLVYSFCAPLLGGASAVEPPLLSTCEGAAPNPACPPPYGTVRFISPTYSAEEPMAGNPVVKIDPRTGLITGTPNIEGQFVVGVCVEEYRNDTLVGKISRDFQFNVARCDPTVIADIREDRKISDQEFEINSCGELTIDFVNESFQRNFIEFFEWRFDMDGETATFEDWEPSVTFPGVGTYNGQLILNPETDCGDTANIRVNLYPDIDADFAYQYDSCRTGPINFTDLSTTGGLAITDWEWDFGDGAGSGFSNPVHQYESPGDARVSLIVTDNNACRDTVAKEIGFYPVPLQLRFAPDLSGCAPASIQFDRLSPFMDSTYSLSWNFGDGTGSSELAPWHTYDEPGRYQVSIDIVSPIGCQYDTVFQNNILVEESPEAGFVYSPEEPSNIDSKVSFFDESLGGDSWFWDFGTGVTSTQRNPVYTYPDTGSFAVQQIVWHPNGCTDTLFQIVDISPEVRFHLPNAFTPNYDGLNDEYRGTGFMEGATDFTLSIYSRWGELLFQTRDPNEGWNGRKFNSGKDAPAGVYVVRVTYRDPRGEPAEMKGLATLIR